MLLAKAEVKTLSETVQTQQTHFAELPDQLQLDPNIPITFTKVSCIPKVTSVTFLKIIILHFQKHVYYYGMG